MIMPYPLGPMGFSTKFYTVYLGWYILYIEGSQFYKFKKSIVFLTLKIDFVLANIVGHDDYAPFHLGLHWLSKQKLVDIGYCFNALYIGNPLRSTLANIEDPR